MSMSCQASVTTKKMRLPSDYRAIWCSVLFWPGFDLTFGCDSLARNLCIHKWDLVPELKDPTKDSQLIGFEEYPDIVSHKYK